MGFFSFIETFFFISLAITFILIVMLVYHFKGRLTLLENKTNTLMEIMNNMVKEFMEIKNRRIMTPIYNEEIPNRMMNFMPFAFNAPQMQTQMNKIVVSDDEDTSSSDYSDDSEEEDYNSENDDKIEIIKNEDFDDNVELEVEAEEITTGGIPNEDILKESIEQEMVDIQMNEIDVDIDETFPPTLETLNEIDHTEVKTYSTESYKSMDISSLKTLVLERGLTRDVKKLKKNDLIKLLSDNVQ